MNKYMNSVSTSSHTLFTYSISTTISNSASATYTNTHYPIPKARTHLRTPFLMISGCMDSDWLGSDGYDCGAWTPESCAKDGALIRDDNGVTAKDGCCVCGGGTPRQCPLR